MAPALFTSRRLTDPGEYTKQIEGPAVDAGGTLFVMNLKVDPGGTGGVIGKLGPGTTKSVQFARLPKGKYLAKASLERELDVDDEDQFTLTLGEALTYWEWTPPKRKAKKVKKSAAAR
jgi:hypothetical protein